LARIISPSRRSGRHVWFAFDWRKQARIIVVRDVDRHDWDQLGAAYRELFLASAGGALGLFTAVKTLRGIHARIAVPLADAGIALYAQHLDALDTGTLVDLFRSEENACLLGTDALRDGVDVPGRSLRLCVFDKVPWPKPTILHRARRARFGRTYDDLLARLRLKQAFGRLIRSETDRGVFRHSGRSLPVAPAFGVTRGGAGSALRLCRSRRRSAQVPCKGARGSGSLKLDGQKDGADMKRVLIGIGAVVVLLLGFMVVRTFMVPAPAMEAAAPPIAVDGNIVAQHLSQAVKFQTVSYGDGIKEQEKGKALDDMHAWMEATYPYFHEAAGPEKFDKSLLFTWIGKNPNLPPVMLMAHLDVVPVVPGTEKDWKHAPFSGDIADGFVWGRGTLDDKGQLIAILEAANRLAQAGFQPERTIMFARAKTKRLAGAATKPLPRRCSRAAPISPGCWTRAVPS
jgi:hypothetical protein